MKNHDQNILDERNLEIDPKFQKNLLKNLKAREKELLKKQGHRKLWRKPATVSGTAFASLVIVGAILLNLAGPAVQPVLAYEVFEEVKSQPLGTVEIVENLENNQGSQGTFMHKKTTFSNGPSTLECRDDEFAEMLPEDAEYLPLESLETLIFVDSPELEVLLVNEEGNKALDPFMVYDQNIDFDFLAKQIGQDEAMFEYIRDTGTLVDDQGNILEQNSELTTETLNNTEVYRLYLSGAGKGFCENTNSTEITELVVRESDLSILEFNIYLDTATPDNLVNSTSTTIVAEENGEFEDFLPEFNKLGFDLSLAKETADSFSFDDTVSGNEDVANLFAADLFSAWGSSRPTPLDYEFGPDAIYTQVFDQRDDLRIYVWGINARHIGGGIPLAPHGFTKSVDNNGNTVYIDNYIKTIQEENQDQNTSIEDAYIYAEEITEFTIDGRDAITVHTQHSMSGEMVFYTIINSGDPDQPAIVIEESAVSHFQFEENWQTFIDSLYFY